MLSPQDIKDFVQNSLGCDCPDEAFRSINVRRKVRLGSLIVLDSAIVIGDRLLVYVADSGSEGCIEEHLPVLMRAGIQERNEKGLNRFRLVLVADDADLRKTAEKQFEELRGKDEKIHLHLIKKNDLFFTAESAESAEQNGMPG